MSGGARERGFASEVVEADGSYEATARVVDPGRSEDDRVVEAALRPRRLAEFPGQPRVRDQLGLVLEAARRRGRPPDHVLLSGPPGLGKTTLAMIVAAELEKPLRLTSGPAIQHAGDLAGIVLIDAVQADKGVQDQKAGLVGLDGQLDPTPLRAGEPRAV